MERSMRATTKEKSILCHTHFLERNIHTIYREGEGGGGEREQKQQKGIDDREQCLLLLSMQLRDLLASLRSDLLPCAHTEAVPVQPASSER